MILHPLLNGRLARWHLVERWVEEALATRDVWFPRLVGIADRIGALIAAGHYAMRIERLPYSPSPQMCPS
ncbi:MAG: hypothetical protein AAFR17_19290 [Pseudomonadota bacterium]